MPPGRDPKIPIDSRLAGQYCTDRSVHNLNGAMQEETSKSTKEQILQTACRLIHRKGFNNTSLEDILRESGVGKGNFYYYFKSKDDLGYAVLDRLALWTSQQI